MFESFETQASQITYNYNDGRCICIDSNARLVESAELSNAYTNECLVNDGSVSVNELMYNPNLRLYPNPTTGRITLTHRAASFTASDRVILFSITGKLVHTQPITRTSTSIDLSAQPNGVYVASTQVGGLISIIRVIKR
ncbi:MAG: T9SS type A sorting domain-containing protein [Bacteroidia bacterium]